MNAPLREINIESTSEDFIEEARLLIARDDQAVVARADQQRELHMAAAGALANAYQMDRKRWTQRAMAEAIGKSPAWVNTLLAWRAGGYATPTAFGPQSKERDEKRLGPKHEHEGDHCPTCKLPEGRDRRAAKIREEQEKHRQAKRRPTADGKERVANITDDERHELCCLLADLFYGIDNSSPAKSVKRAKAANAWIKKRGLMWCDLIVEPIN